MTQGIYSKFHDLTSFNAMGKLSLDSLKPMNSDKDASINSKGDDLKLVADQFEAIFLEMLLKQARDSKLSEGLFENKADDNFVQLFDRELAKSSSEKVDIGIAEAIINQMAVHGLKK